MLLAVGGNSLIRAGQKGTIAEQLANARRTAVEVAKLIGNGYRVVLTHGNGPQVGAALLRSERGASQVPGQPLDVCDASTQGEIGYVLQQSLDTELRLAGLQVPLHPVKPKPGLTGAPVRSAGQARAPAPTQPWTGEDACPSTNSSGRFIGHRPGWAMPWDATRCARYHWRVWLHPLAASTWPAAYLLPWRRGPA